MFSQWAIIFPCRSRTWTSLPFVASVIRSGMQTIVISSTAARPPMPSRFATSPSNSLGLTSPTGTDGTVSWYLPVRGAVSPSGSEAPVSSSLISFEAAFTFVTT